MSQKNLICEDCGAENPSTHKFCSECGNYLLDDYEKHLPNEVAAAVQKLETRLKTTYQSPFWSEPTARPIFTTAFFYLVIAFFYLFLENFGGIFGGNLAWLYLVLRLGELSLPVYLALHLKNNPKKLLFAVSAVVWLFYLATLF